MQSRGPAVPTIAAWRRSQPSSRRRRGFARTSVYGSASATARGSGAVFQIGGRQWGGVGHERKLPHGAEQDKSGMAAVISVAAFGKNATSYLAPGLIPQHVAVLCN